MPDATFRLLGRASWFYGGASARPRLVEKNPPLLSAAGPRATRGSVYGPDVIEEIQRRLALPRATRRSVAREMGISRGTVDAVANGKREPIELGPLEPDELEISVPPERCGGCGGKINVLPCVLCRARTIRARRRRARTIRARRLPEDDAESNSGLGVGLIDGDRERYGKMRGDLKARLRRQAELESQGRSTVELPTPGESEP